MACSKHHVMKVCTLIGLFLKTLTTGVSWYWGNIAVYTDSYYRDILGSGSGLNTPWVMSIFVCSFGIGLLITPKLASMIGRFWTNVVSSLLFEVGVLGSYFAVHYSVAAMIVSIGVVAGVGSGITEGQLLYYVLAWCDSRVGLISALVSSSYSGGSIIINQVVTMYVNQYNEVPDVKDGINVYFTQRDILNRTPCLFLILGAFSFLTQSLGILLIRDNPFKVKSNNSESDSTSQTSITKSLKECSFYETSTDEKTYSKLSLESPADEISTTRRRHSSTVEDLVEQSKITKSCDHLNHSNGSTSLLEDKVLAKTCVTYGANNSTEVDACSSLSDEMLLYESSSQQNVESYDAIENISSLQLFRTPSFYALWLSIVATDYSYIIITNFYKTYGQTRIKDDHFLTSVAMVTSVISTISEICWGASLDRFKVKHCLMIYLASQAIVGSYWYFTAMVDKYLYLVSTALLSCMNAGMYEVFFMGVLRLFGARHFSMNYGILFTGSVIVNIIAPPLIDCILSNLSWFYIFFSFSVLNTLALFFIVIILPYK